MSHSLSTTFCQDDKVGDDAVAHDAGFDDDAGGEGNREVAFCGKGDKDILAMSCRNESVQSCSWHGGCFLGESMQLCGFLTSERTKGGELAINRYVGGFDTDMHRMLLGEYLVVDNNDRLEFLELGG